MDWGLLIWDRVPYRVVVNCRVSYKAENLLNNLDPDFLKEDFAET